MAVQRVWLRNRREEGGGDADAESGGVVSDVALHRKVLVLGVEYLRQQQSATANKDTT
jgi:hypothetical protein